MKLRLETTFGESKMSPLFAILGYLEALGTSDMSPGWCWCYAGRVVKRITQRGDKTNGAFVESAAAVQAAGLAAPDSPSFARRRGETSGLVLVRRISLDVDRSARAAPTLHLRRLGDADRADGRAHHSTDAE